MNHDRCPRCKKNTLNTERPALNSLSRRDNETYICSDCGNDEAMIDAAYKDRDNIEMEWLAWIERKKGEKP